MSGVSFAEMSIKYLKDNYPLQVFSERWMLWSDSRVGEWSLVGLSRASVGRIPFLCSFPHSQSLAAFCHSQLNFFTHLDIFFNSNTTTVSQQTVFFKYKERLVPPHPLTFQECCAQMKQKE